MILQDIIEGRIVPTFAISTHFLLPQDGKQESEWDVITNKVKFNSIEDAFNLMVKSLEELGYEKDEVMESMYSYSSIVEGRIRDEITSMLEDIDKEREQ